MKFSLDTFDQQIDIKLIDSGRKYWLNNELTPFYYEGSNKWHTVAKDKEFFHIFISVDIKKDNDVYGCQCGCVRNDYLCPHIVASLFGLREFFASGKNAIAIEKINDEELHSNEVKELLQFKKMFINLDKKDVSKIVTDYLLNQKENGSVLFDEIIGSHRKDNLNINQAEAFKLMNPIFELTKKTEEKFSQNEFSEAFFLLQSIIEEVTKMIVKIDFRKIKDDIYFSDSKDDTPVYYIGKKNI